MTSPGLGAPHSQQPDGQTSAVQSANDRLLL